MQVNQSVKVARPPEDVWKFLCDVRAVADCIPGLELNEEREDGTYLGTFAIKVGPVSAKLDGEGLLTRDDNSFSASLEGKGVDKRGGSRAKGTMRYKVVSDDGGSVIQVSVDFTLSGALAQVGRTSLIEDVTRSLTRQFAEDLEQRLAGAPSDAPVPETPQAEVAEPKAKQFYAGQALWSANWAHVVNAFKRLFGRK